MKARNIIIAGAIGIAAIVPNIAAAADNGFAPWNAPRISDTPDAVQAEIDIRPWGVRAGEWQNAERRADSVDKRQAVVTVRPWYQRGAI